MTTAPSFLLWIASVAATSFVEPMTGKNVIDVPRRPSRGHADASASAKSSGSRADL